MPRAAGDHGLILEKFVNSHKNMNKNKIIVIGIVIILAFIILIAFLAKPKKQVEDKLTIPGLKNNAQIETQDFTKSSTNFENESIIYTDSDINIEYDSKIHYFQITFTNLDPRTLTDNRAKAEDILMNKLGITKSEACKLDIAEVLPALDPTLSKNKLYKLSFCKGGEVFP
jgi:hypothetical protein